MIKITTEAFEEFLKTHRRGLYELIDGEIVERIITERHGFLTASIITTLFSHIKATKQGRVLAHVHYQISDNSYNYRAIDVSFRNSESPIADDGVINGMPDFAIEIKLPDDTEKDLREAADFYITHGCKMVWLVFPDEKTIEVHHPNAEIERYTIGDTLSGGDVLPDFTIAVAEIFE